MIIITNSNTPSDDGEVIVVIIASDSTAGNGSIDGSATLKAFESPSAASIDNIEMEIENFDFYESDLIEEYIRKSKKPKKAIQSRKKKRVSGPQLLASTRQMRYRKPM